MTTIEIWTLREQATGTTIAVGYGVEALDGSIGKIDEASNDVGSSFMIVDTGPWIFGKKVMLPAGVISRVDPEDEKVYVNRTKEQIKNAPEYEPSDTNDERYHNSLGSYYGPGGAGWQDW